METLRVQGVIWKTASEDLLRAVVVIKTSANDSELFQWKLWTPSRDFNRGVIDEALLTDVLTELVALAYRLSPEFGPRFKYPSYYACQY